MTNTVTISLGGQTATIKATFNNLDGYNRTKSIFYMGINGRTATVSMHKLNLGEALEKLLNKYVGNCVVIEAPQEIIEQYNLKIEQAAEPQIKGFYEMQPGRAKVYENTNFAAGDKIEGKTITGFGKSWKDGEKAYKYAYFADYQRNSTPDGVSYENGIQEWVA